MYKLLTTFLFIYSFHEIHSLIVPDDVPTILSLVYSILPPIKKGTDSRLGWGYRLGNHADIQVLVELGPQTETKPLGNENKSNKRFVPNNLQNALYAQNQISKQPPQISNTDGGKWIQSWSNMMQNQKVEQQPVEGLGEIDASQVIPHELEELYGKVEPRKKEIPVTSTFPTTKIDSTTRLEYTTNLETTTQSQTN